MLSSTYLIKMSPKIKMYNYTAHIPVHRCPSTQDTQVATIICYVGNIRLKLKKTNHSETS